MVDLDITATVGYGLCKPDHNHYSRQACDAWEAGLKSTANVFLIGQNKFETLYAGDEEKLEPHVKITDGYDCFEGDRVTIRLEGQGDSVLVSEWE